MRFLGQSASRVRRLRSGERGPIPQGTARVITPVLQTRALVARVRRSVAICSACMPFCASLSAYRGTAVLLKLLYVLVAAAQVVPRLVGSLGCAASFNAHGAEWDGGTAIEWCAHGLASRWVARRYAAITLRVLRGISRSIGRMHRMARLFMMPPRLLIRSTRPVRRSFQRTRVRT
jgi:hypothetical protein